VAVLHSAKQGKADGIAALLAARKERVGRQRRRMHQAVRAVLNAINTAPRNRLPWLKARIVCLFVFCSGAQLFHATLVNALRTPSASSAAHDYRLTKSSAL
jgi:hypothetical protein